LNEDGMRSYDGISLCQAGGIHLMLSNYEFEKLNQLYRQKPIELLVSSFASYVIESLLFWMIL